MSKLRTSTLQLKRDIVRFQQHIRAFHHDLLPTWQADILTRLIEIVYTAQRRKLPGGFTPGERQGVDRWALTRAYTVAARKIYQSTLWMAFGLPMQYHLALHKYEEVRNELDLCYANIIPNALVDRRVPQFEPLSIGMSVCSMASFGEGE